MVHTDQGRVVRMVDLPTQQKTDVFSCDKWAPVSPGR
jgi:hypothetical protein